MQLWEYCTVSYSMNKHGKINKIAFNGQKLTEQEGNSWVEYLNELGKKGWEMIGVTTDFGVRTHYFKRLIQN